MPITQERFITVLQGAKLLLDVQRNLVQISKDAEQIMSEANSALDHVEDPKVKHALLPLFGTINTMTELVKSRDASYIDLVGIIIAEIRHFDKVKVSNARTAQRQRRSRAERGIVPRQDYLLGEQLAPAMTPTLQPLFLDGIIPDKPKQIPIEETQGYKNFAETMRKRREAKREHSESEKQNA